MMSPKRRNIIAFYGSCENEVLENEDRSTKPPNLENEAPIENEALENEAPKSPKPSTASSMTQSESGGGSGCVRTYKGRQDPS